MEGQEGRGGGARVDVHHPKMIAAMMQELIEVQGHTRLQLGGILTGAGIRLFDLPKLPVGPMRATAGVLGMGIGRVYVPGVQARGVWTCPAGEDE